MAQLVYSDPTYLSPVASNSSIPLSSSTLHLVNATLDELLRIAVHAILLTSTSSGPLKPIPLPLTISSFKTTFQRIVGLQLGKECLLEAEIAVRELLKRTGNGNALKADPALSDDVRNHEDADSIPAGASVDVGEAERNRLAEEVFASLRTWVMQISGFGGLCPPSGPANLTTHLAELIAYRHPPPASSAALTSFLLTLYVERTLSTLTSYLLQSIASITSRSSTKRFANVQDLELAFKEDEQIWSWVQQMKVRHLIENEAKEETRSPTFGTSFQMQQKQAHLQQRRNSSRPETLNDGTRRASIDSYKSSSTSGLGGKGGSATTSNLAHQRRKPSLALSVVPSLNSTFSNEDQFDQLLSSGTTRKLSMTPDRLRLMELERARKASELDLRRQAQNLSQSPPSMPVPSSSPASIAASPTTRTQASFSEQGGTRKKLQARGPHQKDLFNEEEEEDPLVRDAQISSNGGSEATISKSTSAATQSLMELLKSPPPWSESVPMHEQDSQASSATMSRTEGSSQATSSGGEEAWVNVSPQKRQRGLKPKDEKRDVASERQINHDLATFFQKSPPTSIRALPSPRNLPASPHPSSVPASPPMGGKKSKGGFRGFMSKVTSRRVVSEETSPTAASSPNRFVPPSERTVLPLPANNPITAANSRPPRMRSFSAQSGLSFGSQTTSTTYALPPGLGETPHKEPRSRKPTRERQRSKSLVAEMSANKGERLQLGGGAVSGSIRARSPTSTGSIATTTQAPVSILKSNSKRSSGYSPSDGGGSDGTTATATPGPLIRPAALDLASASTTSRPDSNAPVIRPKRSLERPTPVPRNREPSSTSMNTGPTRVTSTAPVVLIPSGLPTPSSDPDSTNISTPDGYSPSETSFNDDEDSRRYSKQQEEQQTPSSPVKLRQLLLQADPASTITSKRNSIGTRAVSPSLRTSRSNTGSSSGSALSSASASGLLTPVREVSHPNLFEVQNGTGLGLEGIESSSTSDYIKTGGPGRGGIEGERIRTKETLLSALKGLRQNMLIEECRTRRDCIQLVEDLMLRWETDETTTKWTKTPTPTVEQKPEGTRNVRQGEDETSIVAFLLDS